jgi:hypothetical protein
MMAGAGRELAIAERTQDPAQRCLAHRDPELLPDPHRQVFQSPAYDPMDRRHRTALDHRCQSLALGGVQLARMARRLAVREPLGAMRVEPQHPVPDRLQTDPADAGCLCARAAVIDLGQCQKATPLGSALRPPSHPAQASGVIVLAKCNTNFR